MVRAMRVLVVLKPGPIRAVVEAVLRPHAELVCADGVLDAVEALATGLFGALVAGLDAKELVHRARRLAPGCQVILLGPAGGRPSCIEEVPDALLSADVEGLANLPELLTRPSTRASLWHLLECSSQPALLRERDGSLRLNAAMRELAGDDPLSLMPDELSGSTSMRLCRGERWFDLCLSEHGGRLLGLAADVSDAEQLVGELAALRMQADEATSRALSSEGWAARVAHDLKEPISTMEWLLEEGRPDEAALLCRRLREMVRALLPGAKAPAIADCEQVYDEALINLGASIEATGGQVARGPLPSLALSPAEALQLLQNLIGNALKHGGPKPTVRVSARRLSDEQWELCVEDEGPGIPEHLRDRLFDLAPLDGIGMRTCRRIAEAHGGRIRADSDSGGTRVLVSVPAALMAQERPHTH